MLLLTSLFIGGQICLWKAYKGHASPPPSPPPPLLLTSIKHAELFISLRVEGLKYSHSRPWKTEVPFFVLSISHLASCLSVRTLEGPEGFWVRLTADPYHCLERGSLFSVLKRVGTGGLSCEGLALFAGNPPFVTFQGSEVLQGTTAVLSAEALLLDFHPCDLMSEQIDLKGWVFYFGPCFSSCNLWPLAPLFWAHGTASMLAQ